MRLYLFLPILLVAFCTQALEANQVTAIKKRDNSRDLKKRMPYFVPRMTSKPAIYQDLDDIFEDAENAYEEKLQIPRRLSAPRGAYSNVGISIEPEMEANEEQLSNMGFNRRRRVPYFYPRLMKPRPIPEEDLDLDFDKRMVMRKRGIPYYYPNYSYSFLMRPYNLENLKWNTATEEMKRGIFKKRNGLSDMLDLDSMSEFGYDKRIDGGLKKDFNELLLREREEEEEEAEEAEQESEDMKKKKKKRALMLKKSF